MNRIILSIFQIYFEYVKYEYVMLSKYEVYLMYYRLKKVFEKNLKKKITSLPKMFFKMYSTVTYLFLAILKILLLINILI